VDAQKNSEAAIHGRMWNNGSPKKNAQDTKQQAPVISMLNVRKIMRRFIFTIILATLGMSCASVPFTESQTPIDQVPMYGGMDRNAIPELKKADEKLIAGTTKEFGSRDKASAAFVNRGFTLYYQDDLAKAMKQFNQAWLLNPDNPKVYWGFASVLHDWGRNCKAMEMINKALGYNQYFTGLYPDAGRLITLCAVSDSTLNVEEKNKLFDEADSFYVEAETRDINKVYVYFSWATSYYWRGEYENAWKMVKKVRSYGEDVSGQFLELLESKMMEP